MSSSSSSCVCVDDIISCRSIIVSVSGFDPWLPEHDLERSLRRHFSSCGEVTNISIHRGPGGIIKRFV